MYANGVEYRNIPGYPGYRVGSDGSVWSAWVKGAKRKCVIGPRWRQRSPSFCSGGRLFVDLYPGGKKHSVHRLVLTAFVGPCPEGMECCHEDGDPTNNNLSNLRWDTHVNNFADRDRHGRTVRGSRSPKAKLNEKQVRQIRADYASGVGSYAVIAQQHRISPSTVAAIVSGRLWRHLEL